MEMKMSTKSFNFIDLFAGCGGLSEGFYKQGYKALLHLEIDKTACSTLRTRMRHYGYTETEIENAVMCEDITKNGILGEIDKRVHDRIDIIIGGPPCQAYSTAGRVRDGQKMAQDPRNYLFEQYVKILEHYLPKFFVFENVVGILSAKVKGQLIFPQIIKALSKHYNVIDDPNILIHNTAEYGVPQLRKRVIIMGVRKDIKEVTPEDLYKSIIKTHWLPEASKSEMDNKKKYVSVKDAISDLPCVEPGQDASLNEFNYPCNNEFLKWVGKKGTSPLLDHVARKHNDMDRERFRVMIQNNWSFGELRRKMPQYEHERARVFDNSYVVQWWDLPSKTILAHIYKDGFQFIHPDGKQARTFTVREAARIQSFPDDFEFQGSRTDKYKQIGNAVPPLFAEAIAKSITQNLNKLNND